MSDVNNETLILSNLNSGFLTLTINRPKQLNALNSSVIRRLSQLIEEAQSMPEVRVIILTGAGEKAFVAGADIVEFAEFSPDEAKDLASLGQSSLFDRIERSKKPVIAAVNGFALGGGAGIGYGCAHTRGFYKC